MSRRTPPPRSAQRNAPKVRRAPEGARRPRVAGSTTGGDLFEMPARAPEPWDRRPDELPKRRPAPARPSNKSSGKSSGKSRSTSPTRSHDSASTRARTAAPTRERRAVRFVEPTPSPSRKHQKPPRRSIKKRVVAPKVPTQRRDRFGAGSSQLRLRLLLVFLLVALGAVLFKVAKLQTAGGEALRTAATAQWSRTRPLPADRGTIFDRNGEELAVSIPAYSISVNPKLITDEAATAQLLTGVLSLDVDESASLLDALVAKETGFRYVERQVDVQIGDQIKALGLTGVNVDAEDRRVLPGGDTGRSVIGRTDIDGVGTAGIELQYNDILVGTPGELSKEVAPKGRSIAGTERVSAVPVPGDDIILTLDRSIQFAAEELLAGRVTELDAKSGTIIVMDTASGDVFAMASVQRNDEDVVEITTGNFAAVNAYEPGSVAKVITVAAGLNQGAVTEDTTFVVPWRRQYADDLLKDSHEHPDESMTVERILVESSNIGTIDIQQATGREVHWEYMRSFGLGEKTALDFPGESEGILKHWSDLWGSERVTVAYGQGLASSSIQLAAAVNAIANDGVYVAPRLVKGYVNADGDIVDADPSPSHEVVRSDVAETVQHMMRAVVCDQGGTGWRAQTGIENFSVAGKTGTGLKSQPNGTYYNEAGERTYYASFVGFFPAEDPQITVLVSIDEPPAGDINRFGGTAAAPVFSALVPTIAHERNMQPPAVTSACPAAER